MTHGERLSAILSDTLHLPAAAISDDLDMLGSGTWDSLSHMQLIAGIEDEFAIELSSDDIVTMTSVAAIKQTLRTHSVEI